MSGVSTAWSAQQWHCGAMERAAVLVAAVMLSISLARARKCCPQGQVLASDLTCAPGTSHLLLYDEEYVPFNCTGDLTLVPATQEITVDCIDVREDGRSSTLKGVVCEDTDDKVFVPEVHFVRKCCPVNRRYSNFREGCWKEEFGDDFDTVDKLRTMFLNDTNSAVELAVGVPRCPKGSVLRDLVLHHRHIWRQESESILLKHQGKSDVLLVPEEFCVDLVTDDDYSLVVRACQDAGVACGFDKSPCINKCCPDGASHQQLPCVQSRESFDVQFYTMNVKGSLIPSPVLSVGLAFGNQFLTCPNKKYHLDPMKDPGDAFFVTDKGQLFVPRNPKESRLVDWKNFCLERVRNRVLPFLCFPHDRTTMQTQEAAHFQVIAYGLVLSGVFLLITFLVYLCLPSLHNLHGKTLMSHVASLLVAYSALICSQLFSGATPPLQCKVIGKSVTIY